MFPNAKHIWRDSITNGVPSSGDHNPEKSELRTWGTTIENIVFLPVHIATFYTLKSDLLADLTPDANASGAVIGDATVGNDGLYRKIGASGTGSWTQLTDYVPGTQIVDATDAGTGTVNAIQATSTLSIGATGHQIIIVEGIATNTATPVTINFNGGSFYTIKTVSGGDVAIGALTLRYVGIIDGANFILLSDIASAGIAAAANLSAVQAAASAAAAVLSASAAANAATVSGYYPGAQTNLPRGATGTGAITAGSGGTNGTFALAFTGGNFSINPSGTFTVAGGALTAVTLTGTGLYVGASPTAPTLSFAASAGLTGAACTLTVDYLVGSGKYYWTDHATDSTLFAMYFRSGTTATISSPLITAPRTVGFLREIERNAGFAITSKKLIPTGGLPVTPSRSRAYTTVNTKQYEIAVIAHKSELTIMQIIASVTAAQGGLNATFNLLTGTVIPVTGAASITALGAGWYLCIVQTSVISAGASTTYVIRPSVTGAVPYTPNGTDGLFIDSVVFREVGTTTNLFPTNDISDNAVFSNVSCPVSLLAVSEALESTANVASRILSSASDLTLVGQQIATRIAETSAAGGHVRLFRSSTFAPVIGDTVVFKAKVKAGPRSRIGLYSSTMCVMSCTFDLASGTAAGTGASIKYVGNGYWEIKATTLAIAVSLTNMQIYVHDDTSVNAVVRNGGGSGFWVALYDAELSFNGVVMWRDTSFAGWTFGSLAKTDNSEIYGNIINDLVPVNSGVNHPFNGKKVAIIGTSITAQLYYTTPLAGLTGAIIQNLGVGGASIASNGSAGSLSITTQIANIDAASDYVLVEAGTNDNGVQTSGVSTPSTLGALLDTSTATFYGALYNAEVAIRAIAANAKIAFMTPYSADSAYSVAGANYKHFQTNGNGNTLRQFQNAVVEVANLLGCPVIDVGREAGIGYHTPAMFYDSLHLNGVGGPQFAKYVAGRTKKLRDMGVF